VSPDSPLGSKAESVSTSWREGKAESLNSSWLESSAESTTSWVKSAGMALRGLLLLVILSATFIFAEKVAQHTDGKLRLEPLLTCTVASCVCGHDKLRRQRLLEALSAWTPVVLLPFFTLAGASLQLSVVGEVLPAALALVALRAMGIATGSIAAGSLSCWLFPESKTTKESVKLTWLTLLAQAGVTLGLVLEVQHNFDAAWCQPFSTLIISVVVINQLLGPVCCRVALQHIVAAEVAISPSMDNEMGSDSSERGSEPEGSAQDAPLITRSKSFFGAESFFEWTNGLGLYKF